MPQDNTSELPNEGHVIMRMLEEKAKALNLQVFQFLFIGEPVNVVTEDIYITICAN